MRSMRLVFAARAFTLVEMMIVMGVLAILAAIVIPHVTKASDMSAEKATLAQLHTMRETIVRYGATGGPAFDPLTNQWDQIVGADLIVKAPRNALQNGETTVAAAAAPGVAWVWADLSGDGVQLYAVDKTGAVLTDPDSGEPY